MIQKYKEVEFEWTDSNGDKRYERRIVKRNESEIFFEKIFKVLCLMCKVMILRIPVHDSIDRRRKDDLKKELKELQK